MKNEPLRLGIAGIGTVGAALVNVVAVKSAILEERCGRSIQITGICARDKTRDRGCDLSDMTWFDSPVELAQSAQIDVFVELIGGDGDPAYSAVKAALSAGKHVVTANKALLAKHGVELAHLAEEKGLILNFEAAVAGGIPIIKTMREALSSNSVSRIYGILNGTCNYMLTRMELEGLSYEACLKDAQELGYAEADPTFDVEGFDTAHKLAILTSLAFGSEISADEIYVEGISNITAQDIQAAKELGYRIKLLGVAQQTPSGIEQRVHPTMVPLHEPIAQISGVTNAVGLEADLVGQMMLSGPGAGGEATASAVSGDICDIAKSLPGYQLAPALGVAASALKPYQRARMRSHEGGYFIRLNVVDEIGVIASIATKMADEGISLDSIVQHKSDLVEAKTMEGQQTIIMVTHETTEQAVRNALAAIEADKRLVAPAQMIRIEK